MIIRDMNWGGVEAYLAADDRAVLPLGSTEQHAGLSLATDSILAGRIAEEAAAPLAVPVFPVLPYGHTPSFLAYPGTVGLRLATYLSVVRDILDGLHAQGFRRILVVNGHGGNQPVAHLALEWMGDHRDASVRFHNWWNAPRTWAKVQHYDPVASHASWMENFPWTRLQGAIVPDHSKPMIDLERLRMLDPDGARTLIGDGNYGGRYQRPDEEMLDIWATAVAETRALIEGPWS